MSDIIDAVQTLQIEAQVSNTEPDELAPEAPLQIEAQVSNTEPDELAPEAPLQIEAPTEAQQLEVATEAQQLEVATEAPQNEAQVSSTEPIDAPAGAAQKQGDPNYRNRIDKLGKVFCANFSYHDVKYTTAPSKTELLPNKMDTEDIPFIIHAKMSGSFKDINQKFIDMYPAMLRESKWPSDGMICYRIQRVKHSMYSWTLTGETKDGSDMLYHFNLVTLSAFHTAVPDETLRDADIPYSQIIQAVDRIEAQYKSTLSLHASSVSKTPHIAIISLRCMGLKSKITLQVKPLLKPAATVYEKAFVPKNTVGAAVTCIVPSSQCQKGITLINTGAKADRLQKPPSLVALLLSNVIFVASNQLKRLPAGSATEKKQCEESMVQSILQMAKLAIQQPGGHECRRIGELINTLEEKLKAGILTTKDLEESLRNMHETIKQQADPVLTMTKYERFKQFLVEYSGYLHSELWIPEMDYYQDALEYLLGHNLMGGGGDSVNYITLYLIFVNAIVIDTLLFFNPQQSTGVGPGFYYLVNMGACNFAKWFSIDVAMMFFVNKFDKNMITEFKKRFVDKNPENQEPVSYKFVALSNSPAGRRKLTLMHPGTFDRASVNGFILSYAASARQSGNNTDFVHPDKIMRDFCNDLMNELTLNIIDKEPLRITRSTATRIAITDVDKARSLLNSPNAYVEADPVMVSGSGRMRKRVREMPKENDGAGPVDDDDKPLLPRTRTCRGKMNARVLEEDEDEEDPVEEDDEKDATYAVGN